ncbi:MAG: hypothetical protein LBV17_01150 [Treponema sp.]|jgi:hypothetical protein|nr:hypothetical protein [Treponema sp.]
MAKKKEKTVFTLHDDEPDPFAMSEEEYEKAREEYYKKTEAESKKIYTWQKNQNLKTPQ